MRSSYCAPLYRLSIGFEDLFSMLDQAGGPEREPSPYPPHNIERSGENAYRISVAVAGFAETDLLIAVDDHTLIICGKEQTDSKKSSDGLLYQGIAERNFERKFHLADHIQVMGASLGDGLLHVDLVKEIPESKKQRTISIVTVDGTPSKVCCGPAANIAA
jgi:molecular chaperone IbpA